VLHLFFCGIGGKTIKMEDGGREESCIILYFLSNTQIVIDKKK
jgi:hypothetical protein